MKKPEGYGQNNGGNYITVGGHKGVIKQAEETVSRNGNEMLIVHFDTDSEDTHPNYYLEKFKADDRPDKKWQGNMYIVPSNKYGAKTLEGMCTAVERSNPGFTCWDDNGNLKTAELKGKKVGIVFRAEEYRKSDGTIGSSTKAFRFCTYEKAYEQEEPKKKTLSPSEGFVSVEADSFAGEGLPFA